MTACDSMCMIQDYLGQHTGSAGHVSILAHIFLKLTHSVKETMTVVCLTY